MSIAASNLTLSGRIAYQGEPGANSEAACAEMFPAMEPLPCPTFEDAFEAVATRQADRAMIPIENSIAGRVADIHRLLPGSDLFIVGEHFLPIRFQLSALPGTRIEDIRTVRSHIHALGQCRKLVREHGWTPQVAEDTAGAAREVAEGEDRSVAALCSRAAAERFGLDILASDVEDDHDNMTRFIVLSKERGQLPSADAPAITSFVFQVRNIPAALYKALGAFATNGVNMTKLESAQLGGTFIATRFYADVEGHPSDEGLTLALAELTFFSDSVRLLGTYAASPLRASLGRLNQVGSLRSSTPSIGSA